MAHDEHDEEMIRRNWEPTECSPEIESMYNSRPVPARTMATKAVAIGDRIVVLPLGSIHHGSRAHAKTTGRGTYR